MKTEISNEFILEAHKKACVDWKARIEKECPELFKKTLEVGRWYKIIDKSGQFTKNEYALVFFDNNSKHYGFGYINTFITNVMNLRLVLARNTDEVVLATDQEVKEALINEAKKRGIRFGVKVFRSQEMLNDYDAPNNSKEVLLKKGRDFDFEADNNALFLDGRVIFINGKWAEIIKQPTEIELIKSEIEKLNERLNKLL